MSLLAAAQPGDAGDFLVVNDFARHTGWLHPFLSTYTKTTFAGGLFGFLVVVGWLLARRSGNLAAVAATVWTVLGALIALGCNQLIGHAVAEPRPYDSLPGIEVLVARTTDFSFASDHATAAGAVGVGLLYVHRRWGTLTCALALLLAFSRVYVGAHYPHDVVVGLLLGATVIVVGRTVAQPLLTWLVRALADTPLRPVFLAGRPAAPPAERADGAAAIEATGATAADEAGQVRSTQW